MLTQPWICAWVSSPLFWSHLLAFEALSVCTVTKAVTVLLATWLCSALLFTCLLFVAFCSSNKTCGSLESGYSLTIHNQAHVTVEGTLTMCACLCWLKRMLVGPTSCWVQFALWFKQCLSHTLENRKEKLRLVYISKDRMYNYNRSLDNRANRGFATVIVTTLV